MKENFKEVKQTIASIVDLKFLPVIKNKLKLQREFIDRCRNELTQINKIIKSEKSAGEENYLAETIIRYKNLETLISSYFQKDEQKDLTEIFPEYYSSLRKFITDSDEYVIEYQDEERFQKNNGDSFQIKLRKPFKKFFLWVYNLPVSFGNTFRKLFRKPLKEKKNWKRVVLLRNLRDEYFYINLSSELFTINKNLFEIRTSIAKGLWHIFEGLDRKILNNVFPQNDNEAEDQNTPVDLPTAINKFYSVLNQFEESLADETKDRIDSVTGQYQKAYQIAGTIEFPKRKLKKSVVEKNDKQLQLKFKKFHSGWENNFIAFGDDWQMDAEFFLIRYNSVIEQNKYKSLFAEDITKNFIPHSEKLLSLTNGFIGSLTSAKDRKTLFDTCQQIKKDINDVLTPELINSANKALSEQNLTGLTAEFENIIHEYIANVKKERLLVKTDTYDTEVKDSEIDVFFPQEILEYSAAPKFFSRTTKLKNSINNQIKQIQIDITEIDHISDFTIGSALNLLESENKYEESKNIALEGLHRVVKKLQEIKKKFENLILQFASELDTATLEFNNDLNTLTQSEKIFDIRLKLAKAKAVQKSKEIRKLVFERIKNLLPHLLWLLRSGFRKLIDQYKKLKDLFGFTPPTRTIASEVSDYLAETQSAIQKLPFVYQRLFEIKPLEDLRFFFGRESELKELNKALANWEMSKFAPTVLVGEKGSGASSLINNFLKDHQKNYASVRILLDYPFSDSASLLILLAESFKQNKFDTVEEVIEYLNGGTNKRIIIIENLQRLFFRKIDGFQALKTFFEIISRTNTSTFWISTCTLYGWFYLDKTLQSSDYFAYVINLKKLNENQITDLVSKRHRVSGYNILYEADEITLKSKTFKKLSEGEKQPYLMKKYFEELNKFAQSNISLALLFWLRSAKEILDDVIKIGKPPELNYSFLESFSGDKIFALSTLVLHDGLTQKDHSDIFNIPISKSELLFMLMHDDGIIIKQNNLFIVNPLLYRQVVGLLKSRNILH